MATQSPKLLSDQKSTPTPTSIGTTPTTTTTSTTQTTTPTDPSTAPAKTQSQCHCSNISIMQLFHEMKQEFPTVPDNITLDLVYANCHNRLGCIEGMRKAALAFPCSAQAYPSQSIQAAKTTTTPTPPSPNVPSMLANKPPAPPKRGNSRPGGENVVKSNEHLVANSSSDSGGQPFGDAWSKFNHERVRNSFVAQRPTTLPVKKDVYQPPSPNRPIRQAPPPPPVDQQPPEGLNVSLNVMVSPVASRRPPSRHTTELQVQPEPPYLVDPDAQSPRSYTSVNFTLRQPTTSPQSPIDISAGPSLTYSSSSFDARQGYQSRLQITVGGAGASANGGAGMVGGGSISAMRARPRSCYNIQEEVEHEQHLHQKQVLTGVSMENVTDIAQRLSKSADERLRRQLEQKQRIDAELRNVRNHLESMHRDIRVLRHPIPPGGLHKLVNEIARLRQECEQMAAELDEAGVPVLGEITESVNPNVNFDGVNVLGVPSSRPKPPRPPPPVINNNNNHHHQLPYNYEFERNYFAHLLDNNNRNTSGATTTNDVHIVANADRHWTCSVCTFRNHPLLDKCEQCEMPNIELRPSTSGATTGNNNLINNTAVPNNNPFVLPNATNHPSRIQAIDVSPAGPGRCDNRYQQQNVSSSASSCCDSVSISSVDTNFGILDGNEHATTTVSTSFYPNIGSQLTNTILLPATVVTPSLCLPNSAAVPTSVGTPASLISTTYQTHRHMPSM